MRFQFDRATWGLVILLEIGQVLVARGIDKTAIIAIRGTLAAAPQAKPELEITEPPRGSIVNPGQALTVKVSSRTPAFLRPLCFLLLISF